MTHRRVTVLAHADEERCIIVPSIDDRIDEADWLAESTERALACAAHWQQPSTQLLGPLLEYELERREPEDVLTLMLLPAVAPIIATITVAIHESPGLSRIADDLRAHSEAGRLTERPDGAMGPGWEWFFSEPFPGDSSGDSLTGWQCVHAGESLMVVTTLEPTGPAALPFVIDDARALADDLRIEIDGEPFRAQDLGDITASHLPETWTEAAKPEKSDG